MRTLPLRLPLRLPPGWTVLEDTPEGVVAAYGPQSLGHPHVRPRLTHATLPSSELSPAQRASGVLLHLVATGREVQLLDDGPAPLRDGRPAHRLLLAQRSPGGVPLTTECRVSADEVVTVSVPTPLWPQLGERLGRALATAGGEHDAPGPAAEQPCEVAVDDGPLTVVVHDRTLDLTRRDGHVTWDGDALPVGLLPHWLAAAAGLGPRPTADVDGLLLAATADVAALLQGDPTALDVPSGPWREPVAALASARLLRVGALRLLDAGEAGLWALLPGTESGEVALRPVTPAQAWSELIAACLG